VKLTKFGNYSCCDMFSLSSELLDLFDCSYVKPKSDCTTNLYIFVK